MKMTNDTYCVVFTGKADSRAVLPRQGWMAKGKQSRSSVSDDCGAMLNHLLPALAFTETLNLNVAVKHYERPYWETLPKNESREE